jgi:hypothetical protein
MLVAETPQSGPMIMAGDTPGLRRTHLSATGVRAAAGSQGKDYWWKALIPSVHYSSPEMRI